MASCRSLVGCCGWAEGKAKYFNDFPVVELQSTFYELPRVALANKWRALAPDSFQFCVKAWQLITHPPASPTYRRLKSGLSPSEHDLIGSFRPTDQVWLAWERTAEIARALRAKIILFQCPASFRPARENIRNLQDFFARIGRERFHLAWEPRGMWPSDLVQGLCRDLDLIHCIDPFQTEPHPAEQIYWRFHGRNGYSYRYSGEDLCQIVTKFRRNEGPDDRPAYLLFNNIWMKADALRLQLQLAASVAGNCRLSL